MAATPSNVNKQEEEDLHGDPHDRRVHRRSPPHAGHVGPRLVVHHEWQGDQGSKINIQAANIARKMSTADVKKFSEIAVVNLQKVRNVVSKDRVRKVYDYW